MNGFLVDWVIWSTVSADVQKDRMISRGSPRDDAKLNDFDYYRQSLGAATDMRTHLVDRVIRS